MAPRLIGLVGRAGAGKSTAAEIIAAEGFTRTRFAAGLKSMLTALYASAGLCSAEITRRIEGDLKETPDAILGGKSPRQAMITLGTEWGRDLITPGLWVSIWEARARSILTAGSSAVVEDVRFPNEIEAIRRLGGLIVYIERRDAPGTSISHASEALGPECADVLIDNSGGIADLKSKIRLELIPQQIPQH
ncbi:hypothetical protein KX928_17380 [Roseobacter sp. YSTF-M11]|uniref:Deoxynucleotide monophosphate kinase n=1 Tax=Roseobacter insulae TaxID=2859783 RepID=A0A9X1JZM9_9RHOB|nr:hypothetical protein [Roseobacter insulae]MBW4709561.1 hypothetical protein [Roseobacter insulae]